MILVFIMIDIVVVVNFLRQIMLICKEFEFLPFKEFWTSKKTSYSVSPVKNSPDFDKAKPEIVLKIFRIFHPKY